MDILTAVTLSTNPPLRNFRSMATQVNKSCNTYQEANEINLIFLYLFGHNTFSSFSFSGIKYNIDSQQIPNDLFKCTHYECPWRDYTKGTDWDFYLENGRNISGCNLCMERCEADENCQSVECGNDQPLLDGSIIAAHCSWWSKDACYKHDDFTLNPKNFIWTCRQKG